MRAQKEMLRDEVERVHERERDENGETGRGRVRILFDLTGCAPIELRHLLFAISVLVREEAFMRRTLDRTCALIRPNRALLALCDLFFGLYTPVRPFKVVCAEGEAERFLFCGKLLTEQEEEEPDESGLAGSGCSGFRAHRPERDVQAESSLGHHVQQVEAEIAPPALG